MVAIVKCIVISEVRLLGFNYYGKGHIHRCYVRDGNVVEILQSGVEVKYPTKLNIDIPVQQNLFLSDHIFFWLRKDNLDYIGLCDGNILIVDGNLLVNWSTWTPPFYQEVRHVGFVGAAGNLRSVYLDMRDRRTLYTDTDRQECLVEQEIKGEFDTDLAVAAAAIVDVTAATYIISKGGDLRVGDYTWTVQNDLRVSNCRVFV